MFFLVLNVRGRFPPLVRIWSRPYSHGEKFLAAWIFTIGSKNTIHGCHFFTPRRPVIWGNVIGGVMYSSHQQISSPEVVELRKEAGLWLKELRERRGLSQRQMAEKVGGNYYTFISQLESGRGRIPPRPIFGVGRGFGRRAEGFRQKSPKVLRSGHPFDIVRKERQEVGPRGINTFDCTFRSWGSLAASTMGGCYAASSPLG